MTIVCPECGVTNKKGNKFCFECGAKLLAPSKDKGPSERPMSPSKKKLAALKKRWLKGELSQEEYRAKLLRLRIKQKFRTEHEAFRDPHAPEEGRVDDQ